MNTPMLKKMVLLSCVLAAPALPVAIAAPVRSDDGMRDAPMQAVPLHPAANVHDTSDDAAPSRYIVRLEAPSVAAYNRAVAAMPALRAEGIGAIPTRRTGAGRERLDTQAPEAHRYADYLRREQAAAVARIGQALGAVPTVAHAFSYALNAVVIELTADQAAQVRRLAGVASVQRERRWLPATDVGPGFIGAPSLWWGQPAAQDTLFANGFDAVEGMAGDGIVIGTIDSGYNSASPSFQAVDGDGRPIVNPLGAGVYLGQCGVPGISDRGCNAKVIGVYDLINSGSASAPYSVEDRQAHGSHTASTAAGNRRRSPLGGVGMAGVAPRANLVVFYACGPAPVFCPESATVGSVDRAVADGVVDVLNYSLTGGLSPWDDNTSLAFLAATEAGIFVAAAGGNTGPGVLQSAGLVNHVEPWVTTVAAGSHTGGATFQARLDLTGPGQPPAPTRGVALTGAVPGTDRPATGPFPATTPVVLSPQFNAADLTGSDGCSGYPAGTFAGAIALVSRGTCPFADKVAAAVNAGAIAAVIANNRTEGTFVPDLSAGPATVPVFMVLQEDGLALAAFLGAQAGRAGTGAIPYPHARLPAPADVLGSYSLLGPAPAVDVVKPDLLAPGSFILAAVNNRTLPDGNGNPVPERGADAVGIQSGTSMASPHVAGAAALLMQRHPDWSPAEIKSALMMTAHEDGLTKSDGATPSDPFDRGAGRIDVARAAGAGLVLDVNGAQFAAADPASGGDPARLNLASIQDLACGSTRRFTRTLRSTLPAAQGWSLAVTGDPALVAGIAAGTTGFTVASQAQQAIDLDIACDQLPADGAVRYARLVLTAADPALPALHLPIAIRVPPPRIAAAPAPLGLVLAGQPQATAVLTVSNLGGPTLAVDRTVSGTAPYGWAQQPIQDDGTLYGYGDAEFIDLPPTASHQYSADDFVVTGHAPVDLATIQITGHSLQQTLASMGPNAALHWRIFADAGGLPADHPGGSIPPVWRFDATAGSPGVSVTEVRNSTGLMVDVVHLDLAAAGLHTALPPGRYWLMVYPTVPCTPLSPISCDGWNWSGSTEGNGTGPVQRAPSISGTWTRITTVPGLTMTIESRPACAAPAWLGATGLPLGLAAFADAGVTVTASAAALGGVPATAYLCLQSNDAVAPLLPVQVNVQP